MITIRSFIQKHPILTYYVLTFVVSWGGVLLVTGGPGAITRIDEQFEETLLLVIPALLAGPSLTGILLTGIIDGRAGLRQYLSRLLKWQVGAGWYAPALLTAPLWFLAILLPLSLSSPEFLPGIFAAGDKVSHLLVGLATGLAAGIFEELGWTGFAIPQLRRRYGFLATGLIVGILWAVWHLLVVVWLGFASGTVKGALPLVSYLFDPFLFLVVFRVLMVWVYEHTESLFVGILMHVSLTASSRIFMPAGIVGVPLLTFDIVWAAALWLVVAVVVVVNSKQLARQPLSR